MSSTSEIKTHLLLGKIGDAIKMLNLHFPTVLAPVTDSRPIGSAHLLLNLRIQNFIEESRTTPLPWSSDLLLHSIPPTQTSSPAKKHVGLDRPCSGSLAESEERKNGLLNLMVELYTLARALPTQQDRTTYREELEDVGGLLAYPIPERSKDMHKHLGMSRREEVADQINEAILRKCLL